jgi:hypothetical protein
LADAKCHITTKHQQNMATQSSWLNSKHSTRLSYL